MDRPENNQKRKTKYFSEGSAILGFSTFAEQRALPRPIGKEHPNNPLCVLQILWGRGKNEAQSKAKAPNKSLQPDSQKCRGFCKERKTHAPFACPLSFAVSSKKKSSDGSGKLAYFI